MATEEASPVLPEVSKPDQASENGSGEGAEVPERVMKEDEFAKIVGLVEDIFVGENFQSKHSDYFFRNCHLFSEDAAPTTPSFGTQLETLSKERFNVFRSYSVEMAALLETELKHSLGEDFVIDGFIQEVESRAKQAESHIAQEKASSGGDSGSGSPRGAQEGPGHFDMNMTSDMLGIDLEITEILLTLKDYGRFQELMEDYSRMAQGKTPELDDLVQLRRVPSEDEEVTSD